MALVRPQRVAIVQLAQQVDAARVGRAQRPVGGRSSSRRPRRQPPSRPFAGTTSSASSLSVRSTSSDVPKSSPDSASISLAGLGPPRVSDVPEEPDATLRVAGIVGDRTRVALQHSAVAKHQVLVAALRADGVQVFGRADELPPDRRALLGAQQTRLVAAAPDYELGGHAPDVDEALVVVDDPAFRSRRRGSRRPSIRRSPRASDARSRARRGRA